MSETFARRSHAQAMSQLDENLSAKRMQIKIELEHARQRRAIREALEQKEKRDAD